MLQSYEAIYDHGRLTWVSDSPPVEAAHVIVTLLPPESALMVAHKRRPSPRIAGKGRILGDILAPAAPPEDWNGLA